MYAFKSAVPDGIVDQDIRDNGRSPTPPDPTGGPAAQASDAGHNPGSAVPGRRFSSKKRVQFKADADLVQVRPITPQSPRPLHRSRSAPSFAEMAPCDPRQVEQAMERARVSDFILSLGCRPTGALSPSSDPYYRIRPSGSATAASSAAHASIPSAAASPVTLNGAAVPTSVSNRFLTWTGQGAAAVSDTRPVVGGHHRGTANGASLPRFYAASSAANSYPRPASSASSPVIRPASANYPRLGFYRKLPVPLAHTPLTHNGHGPVGASQSSNSKRIDVGNTSPFITVRRLASSSASASSSSSTPVVPATTSAVLPGQQSVVSHGFRQSRIMSSQPRHHMSHPPESDVGHGDTGGRSVVTTRLTEINLGATV